MAKHYKTLTNVGGHPKGAVITDEDIKTNGGDVADWLSIKAIEETTDEPTPLTDAQRSYTDEAVKARIEAEIRDNSTPGNPMSRADQQKIVVRHTQERDAYLAKREAQVKPATSSQPSAPPAAGKPATQPQPK